MKIGVNCGHTKTGAGSGAIGKINESTETRNVGYKVIDKLKTLGNNVVDCTIDKASTQSECLSKIATQANRQDLDWFISIHFNAGKGRGCEVYTYKGKQYQDAIDVCKKISDLGFTNRGVKDGSGLYVVKKTKAKSMLIEVCFVDSEDANKYLSLGADKLATAIVEAITKHISSAEENNYNRYKHTIVYSGDDKVSADILGLYYKREKESYLVTDIKDYKPHRTQNLYVIGGVTCNKMKEMSKTTGEKFTEIYSDDVWSTMDKAREFVKGKL
ncbi:TPA: N-acetylmuramoyl-L-alanine amidase [Clostridioides difficile]|nr:N-acetylmuramoyl-L-alanine amidase [Clostridioides difficile]